MITTIGEKLAPDSDRTGALDRALEAGPQGRTRGPVKDEPVPWSPDALAERASLRDSRPPARVELGQVWTGYVIPATSPRATTAARGQSYTRAPPARRGLPPSHRAVGLPLSTGCHTSPSARSSVVVRQVGKASQPPAHRRTSRHKTALGPTPTVRHDGRADLESAGLEQRTPLWLQGMPNLYLLPP
jgi:hypothetical protein